MKTAHVRQTSAPRREATEYRRPAFEDALLTAERRAGKRVGTSDRERRQGLGSSPSVPVTSNTPACLFRHEVHRPIRFVAYPRLAAHQTLRPADPAFLSRCVTGGQT